MDTIFPLVAASVATSAANSTVTIPSTKGVIIEVYSLALTIVSNPAVPFPTVISPASKPITSSLKVNVTINGALVGSATEEDTTTVGLVASYSILNCDAAVFEFVAAS